jgi:hypothetical protein
MYTVELYKTDRRSKSGERFVRSTDHSSPMESAIREYYATHYPVAKGYRFKIHKTYVTRTNLMSGLEYQERYDTPNFCSASSETFWST